MNSTAFSKPLGTLHVSCSPLALNPLTDPNRLLELLWDQVEILLNFAWAALAVLIVCLWLRIGDRTGIDRRRQLVAIAVLIAILFPVISVSDDLMAMQSATEQDGIQRRDHLVPAGSVHPILPFADTISELQGDFGLGTFRFSSTPSFQLPSIEHPELDGIQNRPPPMA